MPDPLRPDTGITRRRRWWSRPDPCEYEFWALATYNAERHRGLVHTPEYEKRMASEQERFNKQTYTQEDDDA